MSPGDRLSPRQRECLRLVYDRHATSKEIATALGIAENTVSGHIRDAVRELGARNRREAAHMLYGDVPRNFGGDQKSGLTHPLPEAASMALSTKDHATSWRLPALRPPRPATSLGVTLAWIAAVAIASLVALALASAIGSGLPDVWRPLLHGVRRLTH